MEIFQAFQWLWGDLDQSTVSTSCSLQNKLFTTFAYFLIWWQPYLFVQIGEAIGLRLSYARNVGLATLTIALFFLFLGFFEVPTYNLPKSNFANDTCTLVGPYGHLGWYFSVKSVIYGPTFFVYFVLIINTLVFYPRILQLTVGLGWLLTLFLSIAIVGVDVDLPAFWCLLSAFVDIPIILRCILM
jgi:hypothetical protein